MQRGLEKLRRHAAAAAAAKRSKFTIVHVVLQLHSNWTFYKISVHIKLYTLQPIQRAIQKMVCTYFQSNENLATDKAGRFKLSREKGEMTRRGNIDRNRQKRRKPMMQREECI